MPYAMQYIILWNYLKSILHWLHNMSNTNIHQVVAQHPSLSTHITETCFSTGKLIAVGVLDVLPHALSSKYFFWDSDYAALSPGKFSALKEAEWVKSVAQQYPALHYYYMGYYIHSCQKMRYKAANEPSDLLCPERLCWIPFARVKAALDVSTSMCLIWQSGPWQLGLSSHLLFKAACHLQAS